MAPMAMHDDDDDDDDDELNVHAVGVRVFRWMSLLVHGVSAKALI